MGTTESMRRVRLFLVSYAPLWAMLAFRCFPTHPTLSDTGNPAYASLLFGALALVTLLDGWRLVRGAQRRNAVRRTFREVREEGAAAGAYLATYLLPLLAAAPRHLGEWLAYGLYGLVAAIVFVHTDLLLVNPTLFVLGWRGRADRPARGALVYCPLPAT